MSKRILLYVSCATILLSSCSTVAQELLVPLAESDAQSALSKATPGRNVSAKQQAKEREQLEREGKCPACKGMGKTPDGLYNCQKCHGTGKFEP